MNGAAVALALDPASGTACATVVPPTEVEIAIGTATADATGIILRGLAERQDGILPGRLRGAGGAAIAKLYMLHQSAIGDLDFDAVARVQGKAMLRERLAGAPIVPTEAQLDEWISWPLEVLAKVVAARLQ
jgi:hypothetical protein